MPSRNVRGRKRRGFICPALMLLLIACDSAPQLRPVPPQGVILAFGDSLTAGAGVDREHSYPAVLARLSGRRVINAGVSGEETAEGLARLPEVLYRTRPDLLLLLEGGNDILRNRSAEQTKNNLASMVELARRQGVQTVLIAVPAKSLFSDAAPFYRELAEEYQLVFEDDLIAGLLRRGGYKSDAIHFNRAGYRVMAESIYELLEEHGAF